MAKQKPLIHRLREAYSVLTGFGSRDDGTVAGFGQGGLRVPSGAGGVRDKTAGAFWLPTVFAPTQLEIIYRESWAAGRAIDMPVNDLFIRKPEFKAPDEDADEDDDEPENKQGDMALREAKEDESVKMMKEAVKEYKLYSHLIDAMTKSRLHGAGLMIMVIRGQRFESPFDIESVMPNDLVSFITVDRWCCSVIEWQEDIMKPRYKEPEIYRITISSGRTIEYINVHHSRIFRFDGIRPVSNSNPGLWQDRDWGGSILTRILQTITKEEMSYGATGHLLQEASIPVIKSVGFTDSLRAGDFRASGVTDELTMEQVAEKVRSLMSNYSIFFADAEGDISRVSVNFGGICDLLNKHSEHIAEAVGIPATRFLAKSPGGLQSTGEGEQDDYARDINSQQENELRPILDRLFAIIARSKGIAEVPEYSFPSIIDMSEKDKAEAAKTWTEATSAAVTAGVMDENEARMTLQQACPEFSHLGQLSEGELESMRDDPVINAQIQELESRADRNRQPPASGGGGGN